MAPPASRSFAQYFRAHRHSALLIAIVAGFSVRPLIGASGAGPLLFSLTMLLILLTALYTTQIDDLVGAREVLLVQRRRRRLVGWALAIPALLERLYVIIAPASRISRAGPIIWFLFLGFITWSQLRTLLKHREVTGETIAMSISIYLLIGMTWGVLYIAIFEYHPNAFHLGDVAAAEVTGEEMHLFPIFIYFSLTTLSTVGFGDILPLSLGARYAAVAEGILGQLYLAILVARLVGMQISSRPGFGSQPPAPE